jgi:hypothetical protein
VKVRILLDGGAPKVPPEELKKVIEKAGMYVSAAGKADFGVVVGGDGRFSWFGRTQDIPLLLVGVPSKGATGSKARLAQTTFEELPGALRKIREGEYRVKEHRRLGVLKNGKSIGEVFTDVYLQRGSESACIRYTVRVLGSGIDIDEAAVGDGVVVSTQAGSTGYYSYVDRIKGEWMDPAAVARIRRNEVGVCHINPTYTERTREPRHPLRYTVPWGSRIELSLFRESDARLYGTTNDRGGVAVGISDTVAVVSGKGVTKLICF